MEPGVTKEMEGTDGLVWNILGQTYTPKLKSENALVWYAELPAETFVPPHIHPTQDEWVSMLSGELEIEFGPDKHIAKAGDVVRLPQGVAHGIFNRSGATATAMFGVAPARKLFDLFNAIHNVGDPAEVVRLAAEHEVNFLPPPEG
jgi:quercetin dioxygenase-like cupin family protein